MQGRCSSVGHGAATQAALHEDDEVPPKCRVTVEVKLAFNWFSAGQVEEPAHCSVRCRLSNNDADGTESCSVAGQVEPCSGTCLTCRT